ncbi:TPA: Panacea domain-containing protein [Yersinia enterocolitica]
MFSEERVAQMAAYLLSRDGGRMAYLKLIKLLYLSDRKSLDLFGDSISGDRFVAMKHGPVLSQTYDLVKNGGEDEDKGWNHWISGKENYEVALKRALISHDSLDELSEADIEVMDSIFTEFGNMNKYQIRDFTHDHCAEWQNPGQTSVAIPMSATFAALGKGAELSEQMHSKILEREQLDQILSAYKLG